MGGGKIALSPKYNLMAEIKGANVASKIVPYTDSDEYATHDEKYGVGGYRTVDSVSEMNAIPAARRKEGMLVYVKNDRYYRLNSSNTFVDAGLGGSSGGSSNIKILTTSGLFSTSRNKSVTLNSNDAAIINSLANNNYKNVQLYYVGDPAGDNGIYPVNIASNSLSSSLSLGDVIYLSILADNGNIKSEALDYNSSTNISTKRNNADDKSWVIAYNLYQNGYQKFSNGLMLQWGRVGGSSTASYSVTMPTSFYNTEYKIFATVYKPSSDSAVYSSSPLAINKTVSRFHLNRNYASGGTTGLSQESWDWFAIGRWK